MMKDKIPGLGPPIGGVKVPLYPQRWPERQEETGAVGGGARR